MEARCFSTRSVRGLASSPVEHRLTGVSQLRTRKRLHNTYLIGNLVYPTLLQKLFRRMRSSVHTVNDTGRYMILFNPLIASPLFHTQICRQLCSGQQYEFSFYIANLGPQIDQFTNPNLLLEVRSSINYTDLIVSWSTREVLAEQLFTWVKHGISFIASTISVDIRLTSQAAGDRGNDFAIDDIEFRSCATDNFSICSCWVKYIIILPNDSWCE